MRQLKIHHQITVREGPALDKYLNDISKHNPLSAEQEVELALRIKAGDDDALNELCVANLRFVVSVAKQYQNQGLTLSDLINEGNMGLIKAARKFDETRGFKFISYAVWWIRQSIMSALVENSRMIRLPLNKVDSYKKINQELGKFLQENQRDPSAAELAELVGMSEKDIRMLLKINSRHVSVDAPLSSESDSSAMIDVLETDNVPTPDNDLMSQSLVDEVKNVLANLGPRESEILKYYYGLNGKRALSLEEIGEVMGLTRERVRQLKEKAIRRLRKTSVGRDLKSYLG